MPIFSIDGIFMLPEHFSIDPASPSIWKKMPLSPKMAKYSEASWAISSLPPNQYGRYGDTHSAVSDISSDHARQHTIDCRSTLRAATMSLAPIKWATCTEKPMFAADPNPPISHPVVSTSPIAAEAFAPRCPTIDASMKNITVADICAKIDGILKLTMSQSLSL